MPTLTKSDIVKSISEKAGTTQKEAEASLNAFLEVVRDALQNQDEVRLIGFGSFSVTEVAAREGVNPRTREKIQIPAGKRVKFSAGKELQDAVAPKAPAAPAAKTPAKTGKK